MAQSIEFFKALQSNAVLIDSDLVGAARLLWTTRATELGLNVQRKTLEYHFKGDEEQVSSRIDHILQDLFGFRSPLLNLYRHERRGRLYFSEDFFSNQESRDYLPEDQVEVGYFSKESPNFTITIATARKSSQISTIMEDLTGAFNELGLEKNPIDITKITMKGNEIVTSQGRIDPNKLGRDSFYPFLAEGIEGEKVTLDQYLDDYLKDSAPVLILIGDPGTGKSTLTRTLAYRSKLKTVICADERAVESGAVLSYVSENSVGLLIMEDVDNLLQSRETGNGFMSALLNESEGVCDNEIKIVITTNLTNLDKVDSALVRHGRTYDIIDFRHLSFDEASVVCKEVDLDPESLPEQNTYPLGDIFSLKRPSYTRLARRKKAKFGF